MHGRKLRMGLFWLAVPGEVCQACGRSHSRCTPAIPRIHGQQPGKECKQILQTSKNLWAVQLQDSHNVLQISLKWWVNTVKGPIIKMLDATGQNLHQTCYCFQMVEYEKQWFPNGSEGFVRGMLLPGWGMSLFSTTLRDESVAAITKPVITNSKETLSDVVMH